MRAGAAARETEAGADLWKVARLFVVGLFQGELALRPEPGPGGVWPCFVTETRDEASAGAVLRVGSVAPVGWKDVLARAVRDAWALGEGLLELKGYLEKEIWN